MECPYCDTAKQQIFSLQTDLKNAHDEAFNSGIILALEVAYQYDAHTLGMDILKAANRISKIEENAPFSARHIFNWIRTAKR